MLQYNELRFGNYYSTGECETGSLIAFDAESNKVTLDMDGYKVVRPLHDIGSIALTPETLPAVGFVFDKEAAETHKESFEAIYKGKLGYRIAVNRDGFCEFYFAELFGDFRQVETVHELQMLFWSLTGSELDYQRELLEMGDD